MRKMLTAMVLTFFITPVWAADLAAIAGTHYTLDVLNKPMVARAFRDVMGEQSFKTTKSLEVEMPFKQENGYAVGQLCKAHNCGDIYAIWVLDHQGHAWVMTQTNGVGKNFGNPPKPVLEIFKKYTTN